MRLLYLVTDFNLTGGKEKYDKTLITLLRKKAFVRIVILKNSGFFQKIWFVAQIIFWCFAKRWDMVFCAHFAFAPICLFLKYTAGIKYLVIAHGIEVWNIKRRLKKSALLHAAIIIAVSHFTKEKILKQIPETRTRIRVLPNSVDGKLFFIAEKPVSLIAKYQLSGAKIILTVSRLYPAEREKGHYRVIDALPIVIKAVHSVRYIIVGGGMPGFGDARERVASYAKEKGVGEYVILPGKVSHEELVEYYNLCDVFVMPSKQEGFGVVFLEALACGKPVIAGNQDASREAVLNGELGLLVNPDDTKEIAEAIIKVLQRNAPAHFFDGKLLRQRILAAYGTDNLEAKVEQLMEY